MVLGKHVNKAWSATQASLALSSGEAEYYGVVRAAGVGLGVQALLRDAGISLPIRVWTDSSAAIGTAGRQGLGKLRHLECHSLWLQQRLRRKEFRLLKIAGEENPADLFTKHTDSAKKLETLIGMFNCSLRSGRPAAAPKLKRAPSVAPPDTLTLKSVLAASEVESAARGGWLAGRRRLRIRHGGVLACAASDIRNERPVLSLSCPMHAGIETALLDASRHAHTTLGLGRAHHTLHLDGRSGRTSGQHGRTDGTTTGRTSNAVVHAHACVCNACVDRCVSDCSKDLPSNLCFAK